MGKDKRLNDALLKLADTIEYGNLLLETDATTFIETITQEIFDLRKPKKVYIVFEEYERCRIVDSVFSTEEIAKEYIKSKGDKATKYYAITEWEVDEEMKGENDETD
jgi:hypothetical protein